MFYIYFSKALTIKDMMLNTLKAFYRDLIIIFIVIVFGLGIGEIAMKAILSGEVFRSMIGILAFCALIAVPITIYRLITKTFAPYCDDVLAGLTTILISSVMVYTAFVLLGTILTL